MLQQKHSLYNLCEWPSCKGSRLAVIGIADTLNLPERLMPRIASCLGGVSRTLLTKQVILH